jgi:mono/diheme cytochrome c family protein
MSLFWSVVVACASIYVFLAFVFPYAAMWIAGSENALPVPAALIAIFMALTIVGALIHVSTDDDRLREFLDPVVRLLRGWDRSEGYSTRAVARLAVLTAFPLLVGWVVYGAAAPDTRTPSLLRIQHPTMPGRYENLTNPFADVDEATRAQYIEEGTTLYQVNCRPCHGTKADGAGPMARGLRLKPADFQDAGTIGTVVVSYAFWRIKEGGRGLPMAASPWDSAMPAWKDELSDEEIWKIVMAEYAIAGREPRKPESHE